MNKKDKFFRNIDTDGGTYIEGNVNTGGGDFVGHDKYIQQSGGSIADLTKLITEIQVMVQQTKLDDDTREVVEGELDVVKTQLAKPDPKRILILPNLDSVIKILSGTATAGEVVQKMVPMLQQAANWAKQLLK